MSSLDVNCFNSQRGCYWVWQFHAVFYFLFFYFCVTTPVWLLELGGREPVAIAGVDPGLTRDGAFSASRTFGGV